MFYSWYRQTLYFCGLFFRVALIPAVTQTLVKKGFTVNIEEDAGKGAKFTNEEYESAGAKLVNKITAFESGWTCKTFQIKAYFSFFFVLDIVLKVRQPLANEVPQFKQNGTLVSFIYPVQNKPIVEELAKKNMTVFGKHLHENTKMCF